MTRFTTPTMFLRIPINLTGKQIYVSFGQPQRGFVKSGDDIVAAYDSETGKTVIQVALSQKETASFKCGEYWIQINWIGSNDVRGASVKKKLRVYENMLAKEVQYE